MAVTSELVAISTFLATHRAFPGVVGAVEGNVDEIHGVLDEDDVAVLTQEDLALR